MVKIKVTICLCLISVLYSCGKKQEIACSMNYVGRPIAELEKLVMEKGDTTAFEDLYIAELDSDYPSSEVFPYALLMANKYNYKAAYGYVYDCLTSMFGDTVKMDERSRAMALYYYNNSYYAEGKNKN